MGTYRLNDAIEEGTFMGWVDGNPDYYNPDNDANFGLDLTSGSDTLELRQGDFVAGTRYYVDLGNNGGNDTLDASAMTGGMALDISKQTDDSYSVFMIDDLLNAGETLASIEAGNVRFSIADTINMGIRAISIEKAENVIGTDFDDVIKTGGKNGWVIAGDGDDILYTGSGSTDAYMGNGNDIVWGGSGNSTFDGGAGNDVLYGGSGADHLIGGAGNDVLVGSQNYHPASAGDILEGGEGNDYIYGGSGDDTINTGAGNDLAWGGDGNDTLTSEGAGFDRLYGGRGEDTFYANGHDFMKGEQGDDTFILSGGNNTVRFHTGDEHDVWVRTGLDQHFNTDDGLDLVFNFDEAGGDRVALGVQGGTDSLNFMGVDGTMLDTNLDGILTQADDEISLDANGDLTIDMEAVQANHGGYVTDAGAGLTFVGITSLDVSTVVADTQVGGEGI